MNSFLLRGHGRVKKSSTGKQSRESSTGKQSHKSGPRSSAHRCSVAIVSVRSCPRRPGTSARRRCLADRVANDHDISGCRRLLAEQVGAVS